MSFKISFVKHHTHESTYLQDNHGEDYDFKTINAAEIQLKCLRKPMENGKFVIVEQYNHE